MMKLSGCVQRGITGNPAGLSSVNRCPSDVTSGYQMFFKDQSDGPCALAAALPLSNSCFLNFFFLFFLKGWRQTKIVLSILSNKRSTPMLGLDSHLKTLYSLTLVLLFSLSFSQSKAWPAHSMWFICLLGCLCQIGNISKHLGLCVLEWV